MTISHIIMKEIYFAKLDQWEIRPLETFAC